MSTDTKQRPKDVEQACTFFWGSLVFSGLALYHDLKIAGQFPNAGHVVSIAVTYSFLSFLIFKVAAGRNWARYTSLAITILWLPFGTLTVINDFDRNAVLSLLGVAAIVVQIMGLWLIFTRPGNDWFKRKESIATSYAPHTHTGNPSSSLADKLTQLQELRDSGLISPEDFEKKKTELLAKF